MFNEDEDWNDEQEAQALCKTVFKNPQRTNSSTRVKQKVIGKKSLLRTLETLGAVPEWKSDSRQQSSDSEEESPSSHSKKKKKKKRRKRGKHAEASTEQQDNRHLDQSVKDETPVTKKRKTDNKWGAPKVNSTSGTTTKSSNLEVNETENTKQLSRQQWKNKMKNKRSCKNKYRQSKPEEEGHKIESIDKQGTEEDVKTDSYNISEKIARIAGQKKKNECKLHKKEFIQEDTDTQTHTLREGKHHINKEVTKSGQVEEGVTKSANGSKQKAKEAEVMVTDHQQQAKRLKPELSKEQGQKRDRLWKLLHSQKSDRPSPVEPEVQPAAPEEEEKQDRSASLRSRMEQRLESARFRYINEVLYSTSSGEARRMFKQDPQAFWIYHRGYTAQVQKWPTNPVDTIISYIHQKPSSLVVADFGCGDCKIARSVKNKVHCFDLAATCDLVTVCDMANVPLDNSSVDIAVFCLSLMGTNLADFISEANRVLKMGGVLKISEVASRFENLRNFIAALAKLGFKMVSKDTENTHFFSFGFVKTGNSPENVNKSGLHLKPCVYKKR